MVIENEGVTRFQRRYVAYATAHGKTPEEMIEVDREKYPGGAFCGFILWISAKLADFQAVSPDAFIVHGIYDHERFNRFLEKGGGAEK